MEMLQQIRKQSDLRMYVTTRSSFLCNGESSAPFDQLRPINHEICHD